MIADSTNSMPVMEQRVSKRRVVVIGFDAADVDLIMEWAADGTMPAFARLLKAATWGRVHNGVGNIAGTVWQSFHSGVWPGKHGHYDGTKHFDPETYTDGLYFVSRKDAPREYVWEAIGRAGGRIALLDAPYVFMPEEANGVVLDGWGAHERHVGPDGSVGFQAYPPELRDEVLAQYGEDPMGVGEAPCDGLKPRNDKELLWLRDVLIERIRTKTRMAMDFLNREPWSYFEANFFAAHCIGHQCWHFHDPLHPRYDAKVSRKVGDPIRDVYMEMDRALGQVLEAIDQDTTVIVYCSHGMGPNYTATGGFLDKILLHLEGIDSPERTERLITMARNLWRSAPGPLRKQLVKLQARNLEAKVQRRIQPAKARRSYFEQHVNGATGGIRVNLEGREGAGIVKPSEYDALLDSITRDMMEIVNEETGRPLVSKIYRARDIYEGPYVDRMPDLLVEWNRDAPIRRVTSPKIGSVPDPKPNMRSGDHRPEGLFAALGPGLRAGMLDEPVSVVDFAPTILKLLDVPVEDADGSPIEALTARPIAIETN